MRIIGGEFRSRRLLTPRDALTTRPIPDRVKESLFGLLRGHTEGGEVFDGFAGTGAIGLEAVSRGAARCVFVEKDRDAADLLRKNIQTLGVEERCELVVGDALGPGALARCPRPAKLIFLDPPYPLIRDVTGWKRVRAQFERLIDLLADDGFAVIRTPWPFTIEVPEPGSEGADGSESGHRPRRERGRKDRPRHEDRRSRHTRWEEMTSAGDDTDGELGEDVEAEEAGNQAEVPAAEGPKRVPGDLSLSNAQGPETHIYASTAVHLYMKRREATGT